MTKQQRWDSVFGAGSWGAVADPIKDSEYDRVFGTGKPVLDKTRVQGSSASKTVNRVANQNVNTQKQEYFKNVYDKANQYADLIYSSNAEQLNSQTDKALGEAYIEKMQKEKNIKQRLAADGVSGGGAESTYMQMANNYSNNRSKLEADRLASLATLKNKISEIKIKNLQEFEKGFYSG